MLTSIYFLGFSYYWLVVSQRFQLPYENYLHASVLLIQSFLWARIYYNRSWCSPYHLFFGGFLSLLFSMDTITVVENQFSIALSEGFLHFGLFFEIGLEKQLSSVQSFLSDLDAYSYYAIASLSLFLSYIFIGDMNRNTNQQDANNAAILALISPVFLYLIWNKSHWIILLLLPMALFLGSKHELWKSLFAGLLAVLHPLGILILFANLWEKDTTRRVLGLFVSLILPSMYFLYMKDYIVIAEIQPHFQNYIISGLIGCVLSFFLPLRREFTNNRIMPTSLFLMSLILVSLSPESYLEQAALIMILSFGALSFEIMILASLAITGLLFLFGTNYEFIVFKNLTIPGYFLTISILITIRMSKEKASQKDSRSLV